MRVPLALSAIVVAVPLACPAQGTLSFNSGASLVRYEDGVGATVGEVQFAWAPVGTAFTPWTPALTASAWMAANPGWTVVGSPVRVGIPLAGRFIGGTLTINVMPPGAVVQGVVIAWAGIGATDFRDGYAMAIAQGTPYLFGMSMPFTVDTGNPTTIPSGSPGNIYNSTSTPFTGLQLEWSWTPSPVVIVTSTADSGPGSLRDVIAEAKEQEIYCWVSGAIQLTSGPLVIDSRKMIAGKGMDKLTISAGYHSRVFEVLPGGNLSLSYLTAAQGKAPLGPTNEIPRGAAILNSGTLSIDHCDIRENGQGQEEGAGIYNSGTLVIRDSLIRRNGSGGSLLGGGVANRGSLLAQRCTFADNQGALGGAIYADATQTNSTVAQDCTFSGNHGVFGGAIYGQAALTNCTIACNYASTHGGGISGNVTLESCTVSSNKCRNSSSGFLGEGGGIYGAATIHNSIIAGNTAGLAGPDFSGTLNSLDYNLVGNTNGGSLTGLTGHNIYGQDPKFGPLDYYGSLTVSLPTMALLAGSPAIDKGSTPVSVSRDQLGKARPYGDASDIGAFESAPPWAIRGTISGSTLIEPVAVRYQSEFSTGTAVPTPTGSHDFLINKYSWGGTYTITPSNSNYHFVPASRSVNGSRDQLGVDFRAYGWNKLTTEGISNGVLHLVYAGNEGDFVLTLSSSNLVDWMPVSTNTVPATQLFDTFEPIEGPIRFYRTVKP